MTDHDVRKIIRTIRSWDRADQLWWRKLLEIKPKEAVRVGLVASLLDARPCEPPL